MSLLGIKIIYLRKLSYVISELLHLIETQVIYLKIRAPFQLLFRERVV
jgi:hypothetical protein